MNKRPMVFRLVSGSATPASAPRKSCCASTWTSGMLKWSRNSRTTSAPSAARIKPWSTNTHVSCSPIASWISTAATALSTPPDRPQITRPLPTCSRISAIFASLKLAMVQSPAQPHTWRTKLASNLPPSGVCTTSGWNIRLKPLERFLGRIERRDLAIDARLAHAPRDQLRHLAAEVDDEDGVSVLDRHGGPIGSIVTGVKFAAMPSQHPSDAFFQADLV